MNYDLSPEIKVKNFKDVWQNNAEVYSQIASAINSKEAGSVIAIECYPGVDTVEMYRQLQEVLPSVKYLFADDYAYASETINKMIARTLTDDRVFGVMSHYTLDEFYPKEELKAVQRRIQEEKQTTVILGVGATLLAPKADLLIYADLARWEIQKRFRAGLGNWKANNASEDILRKFKRGFFFEWRVADRQKDQLFEKIDFLLDTNDQTIPRLVSGDDYREALAQAVTQPFRLVPYFDASVWGGQWMKENFNLDPNVQNYGWAFDGVPEENSIYLKFGNVRIEVPAMNLVLQHTDQLLGKRVRSIFGKEFPIRFDYLDTVGGGNLSLQVHPHVDYIYDKFGMTYTQNESYYILEAGSEGTIYLGVKDGVDKEELFTELEKASRGNYRFPDEKYINCFPIKKHDHYLIPSGTLHCGGPDTVVLEISQTPYIFTFKLWDWERLGLDGQPRPVHLEHGYKNVEVGYDTTWVKKNLMNRFEKIEEKEGYLQEKTGLHELELIETRRHWFDKEVILEVHNSVNMLNLVEGQAISVESINGNFEAYEIHFGETFIIPESIKSYKLINKGESKVAVLQAYIR